MTELEGATPVGLPEGVTPVPDGGKMPVPVGLEIGAPEPDENDEPLALALATGAPVPDGKNEAEAEKPPEMV